MLAIIIRNSFFISLLRKTPGALYFIQRRLDEVCKNSQICRLIRAFLTGAKINFKYSFLGIITENRKEDNLKGILENSRFVQWLLKIYNDWRKRIHAYLKTSLKAKYAIWFKNKLHSLSVKIGSIIILTATLLNIIFYGLFKNPTSNGIVLLDWIIKGMLLFLGLAGLFCKVSLQNLTSTSLFLKWINHYKQSDSEEK